MAVMQPPFWIGVLFAFIDTSTTARQTGTSATTFSIILTLTTSLSNFGVNSSATQFLTTSSSTSWNGTDYETTPAGNLSVTACNYEGDCSIYGLNCSEGRKIRIMEAEYRHKKHNSCQSGNCPGNCCPLDENDCREDYSKFHAQVLYQWCSGKNECRRYNTPPSPNFYCKDKGDQYIQVKYQCIKETSIIDICDSSMAMGVSEVNIMLLKKTLSTAAVSRCTCQVQSEGKVNFELVDIRFFTSSDQNKEYNCTSGNLIINNRSIGCDQQMNNFIYLRSKFVGEIQRNTNDIQLIYSEDNKPAMVWINLKGSNSTFMITCTNHSSTTTTILSETDTTHGQTTSSMRPLPSRVTTFLTSKPFSYTPGLTSANNIPSLESTSVMSSDMAKGTYDDGNSVSAIIGLTIAVIIVIAVVVAALFIFKWRQKKRKEDNTHSSDLPKGLTNHMYESSTKAVDSNVVAETSNYDIINDESVHTYSLPDKNKKETKTIPERANIYGTVSADEYDKIEFEMKCAIISSSYDKLPAVEGKIGDNTYSHVSNASKSVTTVGGTANEYSHCTFNSEDTLRNDDHYSHVNLKGDCKKTQKSNADEENDSYNHIDFEFTTHPTRHEKAVILEKESDSEKDPPKCMDDKSLDLESEDYPLKNGDTGVCSIVEQNQGIKAVSLRDNNNELSSRSKEQQYTAFVKVKKVKKSNGIDGTANENSESGRLNVLLNTPVNSNYELAKPIDA